MTNTRRADRLRREQSSRGRVWVAGRGFSEFGLENLGLPCRDIKEIPGTKPWAEAGGASAKSVIFRGKER